MVMDIGKARVGMEKDVHRLKFLLMDIRKYSFEARRHLDMVRRCNKSLIETFGKPEHRTHINNVINKLEKFLECMRELLVRFKGSEYHGKIQKDLGRWEQIKRLYEQCRDGSKTLQYVIDTIRGALPEIEDLLNKIDEYVKNNEAIAERVDYTEKSSLR